MPRLMELGHGCIHVASIVMDLYVVTSDVDG